MPVTTFALIGAGITGKGHAANVAVRPAARGSLVQARPARIDNVWR